MTPDKRSRIRGSLLGLACGDALGASKQDLLADHYSPVPGLWQSEPLAPKIDQVAAGSFKQKQPPDIRGTGYVVHTLEAALWALYNSDDFETGCTLAVSLGEDTDTTAAVYGQLAGAYYGEDAIPARWRKGLARAELVTSLAERLFELSTTNPR